MVGKRVLDEDSKRFPLKALKFELTEGGGWSKAILLFEYKFD